MTQVSVIGAGPAGSYSAYLLAKAGCSVSVYEEHPSIGLPWACTGVITADVLGRQFSLPEDVIINRIRKARIIAPDKSLVEVSLKNDVIVDRTKLDRFIASKAEKQGAEYFLNRRFAEITANNVKVKARIKNKETGKHGEVESDWLIGADGPRSEVARSAGLFGNRKFYVGMQVTARHENDNAIEFFPSEKGIAWIVPENRKTVRAGIAGDFKANEYFNGFMASAIGSDYKDRITGHQAGPIPLHDPKLRTGKGRVLLAGDAATMVKAPTLGGINQALIAATAASEAIRTGKPYEKLWKARMGRDLWLSLMMRRTMKKFSDKDYGRLVRIFSRERNRRILESFDRDEPTKFALRLLLQEPRLWLWAGKLLF